MELVEDLVLAPAVRVPDVPGTTAGKWLHRVRKLLPRSLFLVVIGTALALRLPAVSFGLPDLNNPDEPVNVAVGVLMVDHGTANPHSFAYPSLMYDVIAGFTWLQRLLTGHHAAGAVTFRATTGVGFTSDPHLFLALRLFAVLLSVGACALVYVAVRRVTGRRWIAAVASATLAVSPLLVTNGVFVAPDVYCEFFAAAALLGSLAIARRGLATDYLLTGLAVGLAVGSKFNTAPLVVAVLVAHVVWHRRAVVRRRGLLTAGYFVAAAIVAFFVTSPAALLDTHAFVTGALTEVRHYSTGHPGVDGSSAAFYLDTLFGDSPFLLVGACAAGLALIGGHRREVAVVGLYALAYAALMGTQVVHFSRNALPLYPALAILLGLALATAADGVGFRFAEHRRVRVRYAQAAIAVLVVLAVLAAPLVSSVGVAATLDNEARAQARTWLQAHVPAGSTVVDESYGPWLGDAGYHVVYPVFAVETPIPANTAAIVITEQGSGRFDGDPHFPAQSAAYAAIRARYCTAASFTDGPWVEILVPCK